MRDECCLLSRHESSASGRSTRRKSNPWYGTRTGGGGARGDEGQVLRGEDTKKRVVRSGSRSAWCVREQHQTPRPTRDDETKRETSERPMMHPTGTVFYSLLFYPYS